MGDDERLMSGSGPVQHPTETCELGFEEGYDESDDKG